MTAGHTNMTPTGRIELVCRQAVPSRVTIGPRAVKESAPIVRPFGGERGVSLASILGASALDLSNEIGYDG